METVVWPGGGAEHLLARAERLLQPGRRSILGIAGAPGAGKSTLAAELARMLQDRHPGQVAVVGMDSFHLGQRVLEQHGTASVKGAPHTFDADGYVALLGRLRTSRATVYAPEFRREIENSIAANIEVSPAVRLVITEGNYLLLPQPPWDQVRPLLDEAWFVDLDEAVRRERLIARHELFGYQRAAALDKALGSDESNARLVRGRQYEVDVWIRQLPATAQRAVDPNEQPTNGTLATT